MRLFEKGFNYAQDGPGNRLVLHLQGCNLHCPWCANPESMPLHGALMRTAAPLLDSACPYGAVQNGTLHRTLCTACPDRVCTTPAYTGRGLHLSCREHTLDEVYDEILRSSPLFFDGGGVTFTGGEPTLQFEELHVLLARLRQAGIHTAIESNATHPRLPELLGLLDTVILDCKHWDDEELKDVTGGNGRIIRQNLRHALQEHGDVLVRIPLIGGYNAREEDIDGFCRYFQALQAGNIRVELLRYHEYGREKWLRCGMEYTMQNAEVSPAYASRLAEALTRHGVYLVKT